MASSFPPSGPPSGAGGYPPASGPPGSGGFAATPGPTPLADVKSARLFAALLDFLMFIVVWVILVVIFGERTTSRIGNSTSVNFEDSGSSPLWMLLFVIAIDVLMQGTTGATPGKHLMKLRVVQQNGQLCGVGPAAIRTLLKVVDWIPCIALVGIGMIVGHPQSRRVGDLGAGTFVVPEDRVGTPIADGSSVNNMTAAPTGVPMWPAPGGVPPRGQASPSGSAPLPQWGGPDTVGQPLPQHPLNPEAPTSMPPPIAPIPPMVAGAPPSSQPPSSQPPQPPSDQPFSLKAPTGTPPSSTPATSTAPVTPSGPSPDDSFTLFPPSDAGPNDPPPGWPSLGTEPPAASAADAASTTDAAPAPTQPAADTNDLTSTAPQAPESTATESAAEGTDPMPEVTQSQQPPDPSGPQWDADRGTYVQWDPVLAAWMQWDDVGERWIPVR